MDKITFQEFLSYTPSQDEISLAIAQDEEEQQNFITILEESNFRQAIDISELYKYITTPSSKVFYIVRNGLPKPIYDFIAQYSTRYISIFDTTTGKIAVATPAYKDVSVLFVITKETSKKIEQEGFSVRDKVGITFQS